jgi:hypothetical protein
MASVALWVAVGVGDHFETDDGQDLVAHPPVGHKGGWLESSGFLSRHDARNEITTSIF